MPIKLGYAIASVATPIARGLGLPCIDPKTNQLRPESGCAGRRNALNDFSDAIFDRFWTNNANKETKTMEEQDYIITKAIAVKATSPEEAMQKIGEGKTVTINVQLRPAQPQRPAQPTSLIPKQPQG